MDPKLFFSDPVPTFQEILDPDPISDPTYLPVRRQFLLCLRILDRQGLIFNAINFTVDRPSSCL